MIVSHLGIWVPLTLGLAVLASIHEHWPKVFADVAISIAFAVAMPGVLIRIIQNEDWLRRVRRRFWWYLGSASATLALCYFCVLSKDVWAPS